jgi:hypothetical protein
MKAKPMKTPNTCIDLRYRLPVTRGALIFGFLLAGMGFDVAMAAVQEFLPEKYERRRYDAIKTKNPFVLEVESAKKVEEKPSELAVAYVMRVEGKYVVGLVNTESKSKDPRDRYDRLVEGEPPNAQGLKLVKISPNPDPKKVTAVISRGGKEENIKYDEKRLVARRKPASSSKRPGGSKRSSSARKPGVKAPPGASAAGRGTSGRGSTRTGASARSSSARGTTTGRGTTRSSRASSTPRRRVILPPSNNRR